MLLLLATIRGDLRAAMEAEVRDVARAMRRGVERAGREVPRHLGGMNASGEDAAISRDSLPLASRGSGWSRGC